MTEVPTVQIIPPVFGSKGFLVECLDLQCGYNDVAEDQDTAAEMRDKHVDWHENGMPQ